MPTIPQDPPRLLPDRPNLRHLKDQAKDLLQAGAAASVTQAQFKIARLYGFASWPKPKAHVDSLEEIGQLKQAIDANDIERVRTMMTATQCCTKLRLVTAKTGRSLGLPNAGFLGSHPVRRDWRWRSG